MCFFFNISNVDSEEEHKYVPFFNFYIINHTFLMTTFLMALQNNVAPFQDLSDNVSSNTPSGNKFYELDPGGNILYIFPITS
jgi:hypothetical protein